MQRKAKAPGRRGGGGCKGCNMSDGSDAPQTLRGRQLANGKISVRKGGEQSSARSGDPTQPLNWQCARPPGSGRPFTSGRECKNATGATRATIRASLVCGTWPICTPGAPRSMSRRRPSRG